MLLKCWCFIEFRMVILQGHMTVSSNKKGSKEQPFKQLPVVNLKTISLEN
jgi:hypothetical protein